MGKSETVDTIDVQVVKVGGQKLVIMSQEEYERLLDEKDAADAERIANDPNDPVLTWDEIKHEFTRNRIAEARKERRVTQKELAKRLRVKQSTVSRMEKPDANLTLATLGRVAKALKCPVQELLAQAAAGPPEEEAHGARLPRDRRLRRLPPPGASTRLSPER